MPPPSRIPGLLSLGDLAGPDWSQWLLLALLAALSLTVLRRRLASALLAGRHSLKEHATDIPEQICITRGNVRVGVDGVIYLQVLDPKLVSYGIGNYVFAITQLAQTTPHSEIGKIDRDRTFEERSLINASVVEEVDKASDASGARNARATGSNRPDSASPPDGAGQADHANTCYPRRFTHHAVDVAGCAAIGGT